MTVDARRRRRAMWGAGAAIVVGVGAAAGIGNAGRVAILNTTDGELQGNAIPVDVFPPTPITALAVTGADGTLSSLALFVAAPADTDGATAGGTIVVVPTSADSSNGFGDQRLPLADVFAAAPSDAAAAGAAGAATTSIAEPESRLAAELPLLFGVSIDEVVVVGESDLSAMLTAVRPAPVDVELATVLAARDPEAPAVVGYPAQVAAWQALAASTADSTRTAGPTSEAVAVASVAEPAGEAPAWWTAMFDGAVAVAALEPRLPSISTADSGADVVLLDRAEIVTLFAHLAPANLAAPNAGFNFRVVSPFADDQLPTAPVATRYDLAYVATARLLAADYNVLSVDSTADTAGTATVVEVSDDSLIAGAATLEDVFGPLEIRVSARRVAGVDVTVTLGTDFVAVAAATAIATAPTVATTVGGTAADAEEDLR